MENVLMEIYITVNPNRTVSLSEFSFFQAFAFADQILPGSGTFNLSVGPLSLSKVLSFWRAKPCFRQLFPYKSYSLKIQTVINSHSLMMGASNLANLVFWRRSFHFWYSSSYSP